MHHPRRNHNFLPFPFQINQSTRLPYPLINSFSHTNSVRLFTSKFKHADNQNGNKKEKKHERKDQTKEKGIRGAYSLLAEASSLVAWTADLLLRQSAAGFAIEYLRNEYAAAATEKKWVWEIGGKIVRRLYFVFCFSFSFFVLYFFSRERLEWTAAGTRRLLSLFCSLSLSWKTNSYLFLWSSNFLVFHILWRVFSF